MSISLGKAARASQTKKRSKRDSTVSRLQARAAFEDLGKKHQQEPCFDPLAQVDEFEVERFIPEQNRLDSSQ